MASITEHDFDGHGGYAHGCAACRIEELEAALSALRARETLLRESLCLLPRYRSAGYGAMVESDRGGYVSVADVDAALSTPAVHGASEATGDTK